LSLETFIASYGIPAIYAGCFAEGETAALLSGIAGHRAGFAWSTIAAAAAAGAFTSDQLWFLLARHAPNRGLIHRFRQNAAQNVSLQRLGHHQTALALVFRFLPGTRILAPVLLSQTPIRWPAYLAIDLLACVVWSVIFTTLGYHFGRAAEAVFSIGDGHSIAMGFVVVIGIGVYFLRRHRKKPRAR
jgi:membrane protein DedA with SNARE-associated domain